MFKRKDDLFNQLSEISPSWLIKLILSNLGIEIAELNQCFYDPALKEEGEKNDFEKMMSYEPMTDDCATKLSACIGEPWTKEGFMYMNKQWKDLLEKRGYPIEAYLDFFQYCFGYKL